MSQPAIIVEGISKRYRLGHANAKHQTFREMAMGMMAAPFRKLRAAGEAGNAGEEFWALKDVNFEVQPGEVVGIIGRNGAGKSTLLKILSRITEPTSGQIRLRGRVASLLEVGTGFHPELTGRENIYLNGAILGMKRAEITKKFDEIVAFAETEKFLDTPVKFYSSGMYVRLAFAVAAHLEPEILIVDEVLAVGDAEFQKKCLGKMKEVSEGGGRTVLFVSHNMAAIQQLCSHGVYLKNGRIVDQGDVRYVLEKYLGGEDQSKSLDFDLSTSAARSPYNSAIIQRVRVLRNGEQATNICSGDRLQIEVTLNSQRRIRNPRIALAIEDFSGQRITTIASYFSNIHLADMEGTGRVLCTIPRLPLGPGRYFLSVSVGTKAEGLLDSLDHAMRIEIGWNDSFGNGELHSPIYGPVITESSWNN